MPGVPGQRNRMEDRGGNVTGLINGNFEADWEEQSSHKCHVFPVGGDPYITDIGESHTPPHWVTWFVHQPGTWDQPEATDAWKSADERRVLYGNKAVKFFTFGRKHWGGIYQQAAVAPGEELEFSAYCHAWSNHYEKDDPNFPHPHDGRWSEGVGYGVVSIHESNIEPDNSDPQHDAIRNFQFRVGIDPTGGVDPLAERVVWSGRYSNYNGYLAPLVVGAKAQSSTVTVFIESKTAWAFCHNDAYFDEALLEAFGEPDPPDPDERQYERTVHLLPQDATAA